MRKLMNISWVAVATTLLAAGSASAAPSTDEKVIAKVPFAFIVGDSRLPAGNYVVREALPDDPGTLLIVGADGRQHAYSMTIASSEQASVKPTLVFEKFANQFFLAGVVPLEGTAREIVLTPSIMERELAASGSRVNQ